MEKILIIVDMQKDFVDGSLGTKEAQAIVPAVKEKIENFNGDIIFTKDTHGEDYMNTQEGQNLPIPHCIKGTPGHEIINELQPYVKKALAVFEKETFGSRKLANFLKELHKEKSGYSYVLQEEELTSNTLLKAVQYVYDEREEYIQTLKESKLNRAIPIIMDLITKYSK